jgi:HK97 gp10 family phage protein
MSKAVSMKVKGVDELVKQLTKYNDQVKVDTIRAVNTTMLEVQNEAKSLAPVNYGRLRSSITTQRATPSSIEAITYVNADYAPFVEFGTKGKVEIPAGLEAYAAQFKGSGAGGFDKLLEDIEDWCRRKGIDQSAAFPIARKIAREGIKAQPFLFPAWEKERGKLVPELEKLLTRAR